MATNPATKFSFLTLDVFTTTKYLGNPLAVVLVPAERRSFLTLEAKQRIAREFNLSETVFMHVPPPGDEESKTRAIDIFTTEAELPFAGHPTIGAAYLVLHHMRWFHVDTLLVKAGPIRISASPSSPAGEGVVRAEIPHAVHVHRHTLRDVLHAGDAQLGALSDEPSVRDAEMDAPIVSIVRGMTFVLVKLRSLQELDRVSSGKRLDFGRLNGSLLDEGEWAESFVSRYYYVDMGEEPMHDDEGGRKVKLRSRNVELAFEDPATGSAACTLASYMALIGSGDRDARTCEVLRFEIVQGVEMGRQSDIRVEITMKDGEPGEARKIKDLYLGGSAVVILEGTIEV